MRSTDSTYLQRRGEIEAYFDRTAVEAWRRLTSDAPVGKIRATVRAGRDQMRATLLSWLPEDLTGIQLLDAGCGTGALAVEAAHRGATVTAVDLSSTLVDLARERAPASFRNPAGSIRFASGDMIDASDGRYHYTVAMDSLIHYDAPQAVEVIGRLAARTSAAMLFTHAPSNVLLTAMHAVGRFFPRSNRAPSIVPISSRALEAAIDGNESLWTWRQGRSKLIHRGFYTSRAVELVRI